jgi:hypothetical protein
MHGEKSLALVFFEGLASSQVRAQSNPTPSDCIVIHAYLLHVGSVANEVANGIFLVASENATKKNYKNR